MLSHSEKKGYKNICKKRIKSLVDAVISKSHDETDIGCITNTCQESTLNLTFAVPYSFCWITHEVM